MRIGRNEIVEELTEHIRQCGGEPGEWCVGTTRDSATLTPTGPGPSTVPDQGDGNTSKFAYREAHTPYAAADAVDYLVSAFGLRPAPGSTPGKIVFVHRAEDSTPAKVSSRMAQRCERISMS
jgi:hypothetical protein